MLETLVDFYQHNIQKPNTKVRAFTIIFRAISSDDNTPCTTDTTTTTILRPFVRDYPGEPVPEETFTHPPS